MKILLIPLLLLSTVVVGQPKRTVFHLPEKSGYQSHFSHFDVERNEYIRTWSFRSSGSYIETYDITSGKIKRAEYFEHIPFIHSLIKTNDTDYITYDANERTYYWIKNGEVISHFSEPEKSRIVGAFEKYVTSMQFNPLFLYQDKVGHISSFLRLFKPYQTDNRHREEGLIQLVDLKDESIIDVIPLPKVLDSIDYGELNRFSSVINGKQLIIAPSYSNELIIVNLESLNFIQPIVTKNEYFQVTLPYNNMKRVAADNQEFFDGMGKHYAQNSYYSGILYDKYRKLYYRILMTPKKGTRNKHSMKIVVLDEFFRFQDAHAIPDNYRISGMFVNSSGLNILNYDSYVENTDILTFDTFKF